MIGLIIYHVTWNIKYKRNGGFDTAYTETLFHIRNVLFRFIL